MEAASEWQLSGIVTADRSWPIAAIATRNAARSNAAVSALVMSFLIPTILFYTVYSYYVFRGKVREDAGYH